MDIFKNIKKEHLLKAIEKIDKEGVPKYGDSLYNDVQYNGNFYPHKVVISYANLFANGEILSRNSFSGEEKIASYKLLESNGFMIKQKREWDGQKPSIWIEKTIVKGRADRINGERALGKALWSPQKDKRDADIYKNMRSVKKGDIVLHLVDNKSFVGVSVVSAPAIETIGVIGSDWEGPAYLIELEGFEKLEKPIDRSEILNQRFSKRLIQIKKESEVFYNSSLDLRQGAYLTPCPKELYEIIDKVYAETVQAYLPYRDRVGLLNTKLVEKIEFKFFKYYSALGESGLHYNQNLVTRFVASLLTKPFVILTGLSGSGKTKLAQAFTQWICQDEKQYCIVPVGADWTNREPLLGYPNALQPDKYVKPDSGVLDLVIRANETPNLPFFLILDEMNLSHVERYFADFLSVMESKEEIPLYSEGTVGNGVPAKLPMPSNLFIIGTVNIDETTNMFSPKVLDRANTIEFRVTQEEMKGFLENIKDINMDALIGKGAGMAKSFLEMAEIKSVTIDEGEAKVINDALVKFFGELKKTGAEFGYRTASEIQRLISNLSKLDKGFSTNQKLDIAIMQKLLPKLHGSRRKLSPVLLTLASFCVKDVSSIEKEVFDNDIFSFQDEKVLYPLSLEKIKRMYKGAVDNGFASFAEA